MHKINAVLLVFLVVVVTCSSPNRQTANIQVGLDNISQYNELFQNKRVGIVTNHTAYNSHHKHIIDVFLEMPDVKVTALFGPEHGIRGSAEAGAKVDSETDPLRHVPIYSLYGKTRKPMPEMLKDVDLLVFDIQDIGARFYTYIYTMAYAMEAAAEQGIPFVVCDRPNPITGVKVEGNILDPKFASFVGLFPIPVRHGMTVGELARMFNGEGWLANGVKADLTVIPLKNWRREMWFDQTGLTFIKPSPNMPDLASATVYPGICLVEGTNVSAGRGTSIPFQVFGAPWVDGAQFSNALNALRLAGVDFKDTVFTPVPIEGAALNPKYKNRRCGGVKIRVTNRDRFQPFRGGLEIINLLYRMYPDSFRWRESGFDRLCGTDTIRKAIIAGQPIDKIVESWREDFADFMQIRKKYLLY